MKKTIKLSEDILTDNHILDTVFPLCSSDRFITLLPIT